MLPLCSLSKGKYIVIVPNGYGTGEVFRVLSVSAPFILVDDLKGATTTIDSRNVSVSHADKRYVKEYKLALKNKSFRKEPDPLFKGGDCCPACGGDVELFEIDGDEIFECVKCGNMIH